MPNGVRSRMRSGPMWNQGRSPAGSAARAARERANSAATRRRRGAPMEGGFEGGPAVGYSRDCMPRHGSLILFLWVLLGRLGAPIPALPALLAAGAFSRSSDSTLLGPLGVAVAASLLADALWYVIGRRNGA